MSEFPEPSALPEVKRASDEQAAEASKFDDMMSKGWPLNLKLSGEYDGPALPEAHAQAACAAPALPPSRAPGRVHGERPPPPHKYVYQILAGCLAKIKTQPTVVHVSTVVSQNITVIGDLHGARPKPPPRHARPRASPR